MFKLIDMMSQVVTMAVATDAVRDMRHRAPSITHYAEALDLLEKEHLLSAAPANRHLQAQEALSPGYPVKIQSCDHPEDASRRHGNVHGRFRDCQQCGLVFKALPNDYRVPISDQKIPIFLEHGRRGRPGGKVNKFPDGAGKARRTSTGAASTTSWQDCYSCSARASTAAASSGYPPTTSQPSTPSAATAGTEKKPTPGETPPEMPEKTQNDDLETVMSVSSGDF